MIIHSAEFSVSNSEVALCPVTSLPEYAFIGRSNVGKSSLINALTNRKSLAKTSGTPGKTQLINHFLINEKWYITDLPGYGYAKVSKGIKSGWEKMISDYLLQRKNLLYTFVLVDSRHAPQKIDIEFINWLGENQVPFCIVFTKSDKLTKAKAKKNIDDYRTSLLDYWEELPFSFVTSAEKKEGMNEILDFIEQSNSLYKA
ncbi:MAG: ribosome biogenesis GTP-binding protein YihA/YsxC [Bacteroidetes bacterium]|nr:ribosome biogenesis GTP-binding protein YihA/YsxC [Bacteroidota bacterium]